MELFWVSGMLELVSRDPHSSTAGYSMWWVGLGEHGQMLSLLPDLLQAVPAAPPAILLQPPLHLSPALLSVPPLPPPLAYPQLSFLGVPILACM